MERLGTPPGLQRGTERLERRLVEAGLTRDVIEAVLARHTLLRYAKGAQLFVPGSPADVIFVVLGGMVKIYCAERPSARVLVTLAGPGDIIGYADFADSTGGRSQLFEAEAQTGVTIALVTRDHLLRVLRGLDPATLVALGEVVNTLWAVALHRCARFLGMPLRTRLVAVFTELAQRFGVVDTRGVILPIGLSQENLAEMIGGSRPMVSKLLIEMMREGSLSRHGRQYILTRVDLKPEVARARVADLADFRFKQNAAYPAVNFGRRKAAEA